MPRRKFSEKVVSRGPIEHAPQPHGDLCPLPSYEERRAAWETIVGLPPGSIDRYDRYKAALEIAEVQKRTALDTCARTAQREDLERLVEKLKTGVLQNG